MYIPSYFKQENKEVLIRYMREFPFAILVSSENNKPWATHVPFVVEETDEGIELFTHISAANPQSNHFNLNQVLVVFREPHAYISPSLYNHQKNVPTWNYVAVHAYGIPEKITDRSQLLELQKKMIQMLEPSYMEQFNNLPINYLDDLLNGIVGIKIAVKELFGKEKLSQNKMPEERKRIAEQLSNATSTHIQSLGEIMKKNS